MRAPLGWLREYAALPAELTGRELGEALIRAGLEVETVEAAGADVTGPVVIGRVLSVEPEAHSNGKTVNWCRVDVGALNPEGEDGRGIVCGAHNFGVGDHVVVALPGAVLPGDFSIAARKTYGHVSDGMICSARELGLGEDHAGIIVLSGPSNPDGLVPGSDAAPVLHLRDDVLDIAVTPDRGYCLSIRGLAREAAQALDVPFADPVDRPVPSPVAAGHPVRLEAETTEGSACPVFVALTVTGVDPGRASPRWLARRVQLAGMRSISLAVDVTNYVMLETGQPIHAYDGDQLAGPIVVRFAAAGEKLITLDDTARPLDPADLIIADDSGPIGLAGLMGGAASEISDRTTRIVVEAANFDAMTIARASRRHKLSTEASRRFERGVDPAAAYAAAHRVAQLLAELGGGTLAADETVVGTVPGVAGITIAGDLSARVLGADIAADQAADFLRAVGVAVQAEGDRLAVTPPTWRPDLRDPYDYVEEVGRLYGYEMIPAVIPRAPVGRGLTADQRRRRAVNAAVVGAGFVEVLSLPFLAAADVERLGAEAGDPRLRLVRIANPLSETQPYLRSTLLPGLFAAVAKNTSRGNDDLALVESGSVFVGLETPGTAPRPSVAGRPSDDELAAMADALPAQPRHLALVLTGAWRSAGWSGPAERAGWAQAIAAVDTVASAVGLRLNRAADDHAPWHPGRCAVFTFPGDDLPLGWAGELHPDVCAAYGLPARTAAAELNLTDLLAGAPDGGSVEAVSPHPVAKEDVALIVGENVSAGAVEASLRRGGGELVESVRLFDVYTGAQVGEGRKSLAFALRFRAPDRTLTDAETAAARDTAVATAAADHQAVQRTD